MSERHILYADIDTHELVDFKDLDPTAYRGRYYELYEDTDDNSKFVETWETDSGKALRVEYYSVEYVMHARKQSEEDNGCKLVNLLRVKIPHFFYERYFE